MKLNEWQQAVVNNLVGGPVVVEACPGSGKTATTEELVAALVNSGVPPMRILVIFLSLLNIKEPLCAQTCAVSGGDKGLFTRARLQVLPQPPRFENAKALVKATFIALLDTASRLALSD